jgi:transposase InsO family protein
MVTSDVKRNAVVHVCAQDGVNQRRACEVLSGGEADGAQAWRQKAGLGNQASSGSALTPNWHWILDFISDAFTDRRRFRVLAEVDDFTRECLCLVADTFLSGARLSANLI